MVLFHLLRGAGVHRRNSGYAGDKSSESTCGKIVAPVILIKMLSTQTTRDQLWFLYIELTEKWKTGNRSFKG